MVATDYRLGFPIARAFTVGSVIITRHDRRWLTIVRNCSRTRSATPGSTSPASGLPFLPLYAAAMGWSKLRTGDRASGNIFERRAGLEAGGYLPHRDSSDPRQGTTRLEATATKR